ncbi:MAG: ribose 5-phosphate isomerase B [Oscillospiraceae bacterium]|jgi:ribose 5-phosphate isomerase B|nr:ribose 5-phosphate isomerase B [Oscillospiraceae bacterium]
MLAIGSDHAGYALKQHIIAYLRAQEVGFQDYGVSQGEAADYPLAAQKVAQAVAGGACARGIVLCGTGIGVSIAANKVRGIRAALCHDTFSARMCRQHNDANVLCMGERVVGAGLALDIVAAFLATGFEGGRHQRRVAMIDDLENR